MSDITTCAVKAIVHESEGGIPAVGATVEVQLSYYDIDSGFVAPEKTIFKTDENGEVVMDLWPNQLGQAASYYELKIKYKNKTFRSIAVVPDAPTALLHEITDIPPYDGQPTGALLLAQMIVLVGRAEDAAEAAESSETASAGSAAAALASQQAAAISESNADDSEAAALASQQASATSETNAAASAAAAAASESSVEGTAAAAIAAANAAADSEAAAAASESNAATSETNAAASAATAVSTLAVFAPVAPASPVSGMRWTSSISGKTYEYIVDVDSSQWVETGGDQAVSATAFAMALALASGAGMVGASLPVATPYLQTLSAIANGDAISLFRFIPTANFTAIRGFTSTYDAAPAVQLAFDSGAKRVLCDYGLFNMNSTATISGSFSLEGSGEGTIFKQIGITNKASFYLKSSGAAAFIDGVRFRNFVLQCLNGTFFEQQHLIELSGAENVLFDGLRLYGFRGDGIYLGSGAGGEERHNRNVKILNCFFDGVNRENRNAISVIDCDGITIDNNTFARCSKSTMPGPIDFEPNTNAWHLIRGIRVRNNRFIDNGGNLGEIGFAVPAVVTIAPNDIEISGNHSRGYLGTGAFITHSVNRLPTATSDETVMKVLNNRATGGYRPYHMVNGKNILLDGNSWTDFAQSAILGLNTATGEVRDVISRRERYTRIGTAGGNGFTVFNATELLIEDATFSDCGTGLPGAGNAIDFNTGASSGVRMRNVLFTSPTGKTLVAIQKEAAHTLSPLTNSYINCRHGTLGIAFVAEESDTLLSDYPVATPIIIEGGTNIGTTVTYAERYARYRCEGDWTEGYARVSVTSHDGAGPVEMSLPRPAASLAGAGGIRTVGLFFFTGLTGITGPVIGRMNMAATAGGNAGAIRFYTVTAGVASLVNLPGAGVPFVIEGTFGYMAQPRAT